MLYGAQLVGVACCQIDELLLLWSHGTIVSSSETPQLRYMC